MATANRIKPVVRKNGALYFHLHLTLQPGRDDDLIAELQSTPLGQVAAKVREMMRNGISEGRFLTDEETEQIDIQLGDVSVDI